MVTCFRFIPRTLPRNIRIDQGSYAAGNVQRREDDGRMDCGARTQDAESKKRGRRGRRVQPGS